MQLDHVERTTKCTCHGLAALSARASVSAPIRTPYIDSVSRQRDHSLKQKKLSAVIRTSQLYIQYTVDDNDRLLLGHSLTVINVKR